MCLRLSCKGYSIQMVTQKLQNGYIQYVSCSQKLARQVHVLLLQFGIVSKLSYKSNDYRGAWCIRITGNAARLFYENIGFRLERKQKRRKFLPDKCELQS